MPKNPSRKLPLQQHSLATVLFFLRVWQFSLLSKLFLFNLFNGFNIFKSVGRGYFFFFQTVCFCLSKSIKAPSRSSFNFQNWSWFPGQHSAHFPSSALPGIAHPITDLLYTLFINFNSPAPPLPAFSAFLWFQLFKFDLCYNFVHFSNIYISSMLYW